MTGGDRCRRTLRVTRSRSSIFALVRFVGGRPPRRPMSVATQAGADGVDPHLRQLPSEESRQRVQQLIDQGELPGLTSQEREELREARRRIRELEAELEVHRRAVELLKESVRSKRRFEAISVMAGEGLPVEVACRVLGVSCAGYYAWRSRSPSARAVRHAWLTDLIREIHTASYGAMAPTGYTPNSSWVAESGSGTARWPC